MFSSKLSNTVSRGKGRFVAVGLTVLAFAVIGVLLLAGSRASTPLVSTEPERGQLSGPTALLSDASASGGQAIKFGGAAGPGSTLLYRSDFSKGMTTLKPEGTDCNSNQNASFPIVDGAAVMRIKVVQGMELGCKIQSRFSHLGIANRAEAILKYEMFIPTTANMNYQGKLPGLSGLPDGQGPWYTSSGGNMKADSFSVRYHVRPSTTYSVGYPWLDTYIYAWHAGGKVYGANGYNYGISFPITTDLSHSHSSKRQMRIPQGKWFAMQIRVKLNTPGVNNGVLEMWVDGVKGASFSDVQWNKAGVNTQISQIFYQTFANANPSYPNTSNYDYRNIEVWAP